MAETLKTKEDIFFTMKTEIKRKEVELSEVSRSLQEYRGEYERVRCAEEEARREADRAQRQLDGADRVNFEKVTRLELEMGIVDKKL